MPGCQRPSTHTTHFQAGQTHLEEDEVCGRCKHVIVLQRLELEPSCFYVSVGPRSGGACGRGVGEGAAQGEGGGWERERPRGRVHGVEETGHGA